MAFIAYIYNTMLTPMAQGIPTSPVLAIGMLWFSLWRRKRDSLFCGKATALGDVPPARPQEPPFESLQGIKRNSRP
jgi:hypothetical protein